MWRTRHQSTSSRFMPKASQMELHRKCLRTLNLLREEGAKKSLPNTPLGQNFGARANEATQNFTERVYISDLHINLVILPVLIRPLA